MTGQKSPEKTICNTCNGTGEIITNWNGYMHAETKKEREEAVQSCEPCEGTGAIEIQSEPQAA